MVAFQDRLVLVLLALVLCLPASAQEPATHDDLVRLFHEWRAFEQPDLIDGAPDYSAKAMTLKAQGLRHFQRRLTSMDVRNWSIEEQVDYHLVRAEMNGMDFNIRVLKPWARDPAFYTSVWTYQSDTPAHEGPTHHALVELWTYDFPLTDSDQNKLATELATISPLLSQARHNLVGNARELWISGIDNLRQQASVLNGLLDDRNGMLPDLEAALKDAHQASEDFVTWLEEQAPSKTEPSGIGKDNYTWYLQNVHLVPLTWEDEVRLLKRELDRAHASLRLEEHRNRKLPDLVPIASPEEYEVKANAAVDKYMAFLKDQDILPVRDYMDPALRARIGSFVPEESRNFFRTAIHFEPMTLWTHFYHWWDLARMEADPHPSPIRRGPLLYNIFDSRAEGIATGVEEMMMHAGLYDDNPRAREIVWIMLAQRAARGLGSLYVHANDFTMKQARDFHVAWTPRGWMREDLDLLGFEQQLYLRQPGYGSTYITGKYLVERLLAERSRQMGEDFSLSAFYEEVDATGVIPVSLIRWQLTGKDDEMRALVPPPVPVPDFQLSADQTHNRWSRTIPPVLTVPSGSVVEVFTEEATDQQFDVDSTAASVAELDFDPIHPLTGPVYVETAKPGDVLAVTLLDIELGDWGWTAIAPGFGLLADRFTKPAIKTFRFDHGTTHAAFSDNISIPLDPFPGVLGVAPDTDEMLSTIPPRANGGNMDNQYMTEGTTVYLPVFVDGALFSIGDTHAAQGDGEVCGTAIEAPMRIVYRVEVLKNFRPMAEPQYETDDFYGVTAFAETLDEATRKATEFMIDYLVQARGLSEEDAYMLASLAGDLKISEVVDVPHVLVSMHMPKSIFQDSANSQ